MWPLRNLFEYVVKRCSEPTQKYGFTLGSSLVHFPVAIYQKTWQFRIICWMPNLLYLIVVAYDKTLGYRTQYAQTFCNLLHLWTWFHSDRWYFQTGIYSLQFSLCMTIIIIYRKISFFNNAHMSALWLTRISHQHEYSKCSDRTYMEVFRFRGSGFAEGRVMQLCFNTV